MAEICLQGLAHSYADNPQQDSDYALQKFTHTWKQGGAYALLGPSGCGKSTLLNIISGLLTPTQGEVLFDGKTVNALSPQQRNIAQVFQFPVVYDGMTVFDNLAFPLRNMKLPKAQIHAKVHEISELMELTEVLNSKARNLSADLKQKIAMARGLVREDVSAILFDEPLTVIDPHLKWKLRRKLKQIHQQLNITMLYVTHDQLEAATFADEIAVMYQGRIVQFGTPQALFEKPNHTFVGYFIGSPGMNILPLQQQGHDYALGSQVVRFSEAQQQALASSQSSNIKIGIRPEYVQIAAEPAQEKDQPHNAFPAQVQAIEDYGTYQLVTLQLADSTLMMRSNTTANLAVGDNTHVYFPADKLKLYIDEYLSGEVMDE